MGLVLVKCCRNTVEPSEFPYLSQKRIMTCENCGIRFSILKRKKKCPECLKDFCSACLIKEPGPRNLFCHTCRILTEVPVDRAELMKLRIRDLQRFLMLKNIPTNSCTEKKELVDLIIAREASSNRPRNSAGVSPSHAGYRSPASSSARSQRNGRNPPQTNVNVPLTTQATVHNTSQPSKPDPPLIDLSPANEAETKSFVDEDVDNLSVRQLKEVLTKNFVTYRGCCEKSELVKLAKRLQNEMKENNKRVTMGLPEENLCKICMDAPVDCVLLDCGHMLSCTDCGKVLNECPVCRSYVVRVVRTFKA